MKKGIFITATDTDVGKTCIASGLAAALQRRWGGSPSSSSPVNQITIEGSPPSKEGACIREVRLWKPIQTGVRLGDPDSDSYRLKHGGGTGQNEEDLVTLTLPEPLAPWMAAERANCAIDFAALVEEGKRRLEPANRFLIVEGAGGLMVPITGDRLMSDLANELALPLVIVARPKLGTVNHTLLTVSYAQSCGIRVAGVIVNGCMEDEMQAISENVRMIETFGRVPVLGMLPWFYSNPATEEEWAGWRERWAHIIAEHVDLSVFESQSY